MKTIYDRINFSVDFTIEVISNLINNVIPKQPPNEADQTVEEIVEIYLLFKEKDTFLFKYWEQLSKRINENLYNSTEIDVKVVELMKKGYYTNNLRRISHLLQDFEVSKLFNEQFVTSIPTSIKVFSIANWPATRSDERRAGKECPS